MSLRSLSLPQRLASLPRSFKLNQRAPVIHSTRLLAARTSGSSSRISNPGLKSTVFGSTLHGLRAFSSAASQSRNHNAGEVDDQPRTEDLLPGYAASSVRNTARNPATTPARQPKRPSSAASVNHNGISTNRFSQNSNGNGKTNTNARPATPPRVKNTAGANANGANVLTNPITGERDSDLGRILSEAKAGITFFGKGAGKGGGKNVGPAKGAGKPSGKGEGKNNDMSNGKTSGKVGKGEGKGIIMSAEGKGSGSATNTTTTTATGAALSKAALDHNANMNNPNNPMNWLSEAEQAALEDLASTILSSKQHLRALVEELEDVDSPLRKETSAHIRKRVLVKAFADCIGRGKVNGKVSETGGLQGMLARELPVGGKKEAIYEQIGQKTTTPWNKKVEEIIEGVSKVEEITGETATEDLSKRLPHVALKRRLAHLFGVNLQEECVSTSGGASGSGTVTETPLLSPSLSVDLVEQTLAATLLSTINHKTPPYYTDYKGAPEEHKPSKTTSSIETTTQKNTKTTSNTNILPLSISLSAPLHRSPVQGKVASFFKGFQALAAEVGVMHHDPSRATFDEHWSAAEVAALQEREPGRVVGEIR
jgi:hypothetical protein